MNPTVFTRDTGRPPSALIFGESTSQFNQCVLSLAHHKVFIGASCVKKGGRETSSAFAFCLSAEDSTTIRFDSLVEGLAQSLLYKVANVREFVVDTIVSVNHSHN